jgi:poly(A) polymerase
MDTHSGESMKASAMRIVQRLQEAGFAAFWVGGCVRDLLLDREPGDYDIATGALSEEIEKLFPKVIPVGRKFGVVVVVENEHQFQVATFRAEAEYHDGRHPARVSVSDAKADALRRDFTVNGLFLDPVKDELHDWVRGKRDLKARVIRTIGRPEERFAEDHLRLLRAVRFAAQLDFTIEPETFAMVRAHAGRIKGISAERVREELVKLLQPPHAARGLQLLQDSGLLAEVLPEIAVTAQCEQSPDFHPEGNVFQHIVLMLKQLPAHSDPLLPWAVLLHDVAKPVTASCDRATGSIHFYGHERIGAEMSQSIMERLRFPRRQIDNVVKAVRYHMQFKDAPQMRKSTLRRLLMRPTFSLELQLHRLDCLGSHGGLEIYDYLVKAAEALDQKPEIRPPLVRGDDLLALGMLPGPELGALLAEIREKQLQDELTSADEAREYARRKLRQQSTKARGRSKTKPNLPPRPAADARRRGSRRKS